jgi:AcrR family transcriptional regulator
VARGAGERPARPDVKEALLDATEGLMLREGYAAVSARRVASEAGVTLGLLHYYFGPMESLLLGVFRRRAEWLFARQATALDCEQPLWALWDVTREYASTPLNVEFLAMGNHYPAIQDELRVYSSRFRTLQCELVERAMAARGVDSTVWPAQGLVLVIEGVSRFLGSETTAGLSFGHAEAGEIIERLIVEIEGPRPNPSARRARRA